MMAVQSQYDLIKEKGKGGNIYAIDHDEMLKLAFKNFLNPETDDKKI